MADLTTVDNVKQWLGLTSAADDALLTRLISAISQRVRTHLRRDILTASYAYTFDGPGSQRWPMPQYPITAVASVSVDGISIPAAAGSGGAGYYFTADTLYLRGYSFSRGLGNVTVSYTAGYADVPPEIEQCVIEWLALRYKERDRIGHQSKSLAGETVSFFIGSMPKSVEDSLKTWRNVVPA